MLSAFGLRARQTTGQRLARVALGSGVGRVSREPIGSDDCQALERVPHRLPDAGHTVECTHGRKHMGGIGTLPSFGAHELARHRDLQHGIEQMVRSATGNQTGAELAQHRAVEAGISQRVARQSESGSRIASFVDAPEPRMIASSECSRCLILVLPLPHDYPSSSLPLLPQRPAYGRLRFATP